MVKIQLLMSEFVTHDVKRFIFEKPEGFSFEPGQATTLSLDKDDWRDEERPFTFTSSNDDKIIEFTIKRYNEHNGVTKRLHELSPGDYVMMGDTFGSIRYKGKGVFIAGGTGITPFIAIFRDLHAQQKLEGDTLFFSNKKSKDIIIEKELKEYFGNDAHFILTEEGDKHIDKEFLKKRIDDFSQKFYICGPPKFVEDISTAIEELGGETENLIFD